MGTTIGTTASTNVARLSLMRGFDLRIGDESILLAANAQRVIAFLGLRARPEQRSVVATTLWTDTTEERARAKLRAALWKLARLRQDFVRSHGPTLALAPGVGVDVDDLRTRAAALLTPSVENGAELEGSVDDLRADLLPDWDEDWIIFERERLRQLRIHALEALCRRRMAMGRFAEAVDAGLASVECEPLRESGQQTLIEAHLAEGNISEARRQFHAFRRLLWDEMRLRPADRTWALVGLVPS